MDETRVDVKQAAALLEHYLARVDRGEEIVLTVAGQPMVRLVLTDMAREGAAEPSSGVQPA